MTVPGITKLREAEEGDRITIWTRLTGTGFPEDGERQRLRGSIKQRGGQDAVREENGNIRLTFQDSRGRWGGLEIDGDEVNLMLEHADGISSSTYSTPVSKVRVGN